MTDDYADDYDFDTEPLGEEYYTGAVAPAASKGATKGSAVNPARGSVAGASNNRPAALNANLSADSSPLSAHSDDGSHSQPNQMQGGDGGGGGGPQVEEMAVAHNALVAGLTHSGVLGKIKAQLRASMLGILKNNPAMIANNLMLPSWQLNKRKASNKVDNLSEAQRMGLVVCADFLASLDLDLTIGILEEECGGAVTRARAEWASKRPEGAAILTESAAAGDEADKENRHVAGGVQSLSPSSVKHNKGSANDLPATLSAPERRLVRAAATAALRDKLGLPAPATSAPTIPDRPSQQPASETILDQLLSLTASGGRGGLVALLGDKHHDSAMAEADPYNGNVSIMTNQGNISGFSNGFSNGLPQVGPSGNVVHVTNNNNSAAGAIANHTAKLSKPLEVATPPHGAVTGFFEHSLMSLRGSGDIEDESAGPSNHNLASVAMGHRTGGPVAATTVGGNEPGAKPVTVGDEANAIIAAAIASAGRAHPNGSFSSVEYSDHNSECESEGAYDHVEDVTSEAAAETGKAEAAPTLPPTKHAPTANVQQPEEQEVDEEVEDDVDEEERTPEKAPPANASKPPLPTLVSTTTASADAKETFEPYEDDEDSEDMYGSDRFANEDEDDDTF